MVNPSEILAKLFDAIPKEIPIAKNIYPNKGFMKPLFGYIFLAIGISFGIASNSLAKISEGFTKLTPSVLCILFMCITMFSIAKAMHALPVGFAYATYSGLTVTGVVLFAVLKLNQVPNLYGIIGIILIIIGVIMVNYLGRLN